MSKPVIIDFEKELVFTHQAWEKIHKFAESGAVVRNITLYGTVNRVEWSKVFWDLIKDLPNLRLTNKQVSEFFNQPGIVVFIAEVNNKLLGMMVFDFQLNWHSEYHQDLSADYWLAGYSSSDISCSYALMYEAIQFFKQIGCDSINLGHGENYNISAEDLISWKNNFIGKCNKPFELRKS